MAPTRPANGERTFLRWLAGIASAALLAWAGWVSVSVVQAAADRATLQEVKDDVKYIRGILDRRPAR